MDILHACEAVHRWAELLSPGSSGGLSPGSLTGAVAEIKRYLENARGDGKRIRELEVKDDLLMTREGIRWVLPFVLSAESMEASKRRRAMG
jgi:hypothetical protein